MARGVIGVPNKDTGNTGIHSRSHQEGHAISDSRRSDICNSRIAGNCERERNQHHDTAEANAVRYNGNNDLTPSQLVGSHLSA